MITICSQTWTFNLLIFFKGGGQQVLVHRYVKFPLHCYPYEFLFFLIFMCSVYIPRKTMVSIRNVHKEWNKKEHGEVQTAVRV